MEQNSRFSSCARRLSSAPSFSGGNLAAVTSLCDAEIVPRATASSGSAQAGEDRVKVKSFHCKQKPQNKRK